MKEKLTQENQCRWQEALRKVAIEEQKYSARIEYILQTIFKTFGKKLDGWWYPLNGNEQCSLSDAIGYGAVKYETRTPLKNAVIILNNGGEFGLEYEFPEDWLYKDFEEELLAGKNLYKVLEIQKAEKAKAVRAEKLLKKANLIESAKAKLTKEELRALKI